MLDWNDAELENILWGEAAESDDHIVPYKATADEKNLVLFGDNYKKEWNQEAAFLKSSDQNSPNSKAYVHGKQDMGSHFGTNGHPPASGLGMDLWPNSSLSSAIQNDQDSIGNEVSNNLTEITKMDLCRVETTLLENDPGMFQNQPEDAEHSEFVDYGWTDVGSFDDLDRILCNDDPMFGHASLGDTDELWSSSKDVINGRDSPSLGLGTLRNSSNDFEIKSECVQHEDQSFTPGPTFHGLQSTHANLERVEYAGLETKPLPKGKVTRQNKGLKGQKKSEEKNKGRLRQDFSCPLPLPGNQFTCPSPIFMQQRQPQELESLRYPQHMPNLYMPFPAYGNLSNQYSVVPVLSNIHSGEDNKHQPMISGYQVSSGNATTVNPVTMTPQEKIVKLKRRQHMQAVRAIQNEKKQFTHQASCISVSENKRTLHASDSNSPIERDDSNSISMEIDDHYWEDTVYRLQDVVSKLDIRIRLCLRDSFFRLARDVKKRQVDNDTSSTNRIYGDGCEAAATEEINSSGRFCAKPADAETATNPLDRAVASLLFTNLPMLPGKHPKSPIPSTKPYYETVRSSGLDRSENASNNEPVDGRAMELDASQ